MHTVDLYLLKNSLYIFLLANIIGFFPLGKNLFPWLNAIAFCLCLLMLYLIRLTVRRYAAEFENSPEEVKMLLGKYIEDDKRGKLSFHDYLKNRRADSVGTQNHPGNPEATKMG